MDHDDVVAKLLVATLIYMTLGTPVVAANGLELSFQDGLVTLRATNVPIRTILAEWARLGDTKFINSDKLLESLVSLQLVDMPENKALRLLLRSTAGYLAVPRPVGNPGGSSLNRVLIMASSRPATSSEGYMSAFEPQVNQPVSGDEFPSARDNVEELSQLRRRLLPLPNPEGAFVSSLDQSLKPTLQSDHGAQTAPRPGMIVAPSEQPPLRP